MKKLKKILLLITAISMTLALSACSSYSGIESRMKKAGFELFNEENTETKTITSAVNSMQLDCTVHIFSKKYEGAVIDLSSFAIILEFNSNEELETAMEEKIEKSSALKGFFTDLEKSQYINGNCVLIAIPIETISTSASDILNEMTEAFK